MCLFIFTLSLFFSILNSGLCAASNQIPVAQNDTAEAPENGFVDINVLDNDSDPDGDPLSVVGVNRGLYGNLVINEDNTITYTPIPGFVGTDSFTYTISDDKRGMAVGMVTVTVAPVEQPPTIAITSPPEHWYVNQGELVEFVVDAADSDGVVEEITFYLNGEFLAVVPGTQTTFSWQALETGTFEVKAVARDDDGLVAVSNTINLTVSEVINNPPVVWIAEPMSGATYTEGQDVTIKADGYDRDGVIRRVEFYADELLIGTANTCPCTFVWKCVSGGTWTLRVRAYDDKGVVCVSAPVEIWVNHFPVAVDDMAVGKQNEPLTIDVLDNDYDPDGNEICISSVTKPEHGSALIRGRTILFTPDLDFYGTDYFIYTITNSCGLTAKAKVWIELKPSDCDIPQVTITCPAEGAVFGSGQNIRVAVHVSDQGTPVVKVGFYDGGTLLGFSYQPPFDFVWLCPAPGIHSLTARAVNKAGDMGVSKPVTITVNPPPDCPPTVEITDPKNGAIFLEGTNIPICAAVSDKEGPVIRVDFYQDEFLIGSSTVSPFRIVWPRVRPGKYTLRAKAVDKQGEVAISAPVTILVHCPPVAHSDNVIIDQNTRIDIDVLKNDTDPDNDTLCIESVSQPPCGRTMMTDDGKIRYEPRANFVGVDPFVYVVKDSCGGRGFGFVTVTVRAIPGPPFVIISSPSDGAMVTAGKDVRITVRTGARNAEVVKVDYFCGEKVLATVTQSPFGYTWKKVPAGSHVLTAKVTDSNGDCSISSPVHIEVNSPPVARNDMVTTIINTAIDMNILGNDEDPDGEAITLKKANQPSHGVLSVFDAKISYLPEPGFLGTDEFTYCIVDPHGLEASAKVIITVTPVPDLPTITITSPVHGATLTAGDTITITANLVQAGTAVSRVEFYEGDCVLGYATCSPYSITWSDIPAGRRTLAAAVIDAKGNAIVSDALTVQISPAQTLDPTTTPPPAPPVETTTEEETPPTGPCAMFGLIVLALLSWLLHQSRITG